MNEYEIEQLGDLDWDLDQHEACTARLDGQRESHSTEVVDFNFSWGSFPVCLLWCREDAEAKLNSN